LADHANRRYIAFGGLLNARSFSRSIRTSQQRPDLVHGSLESIGGVVGPSISSLMSQGAVHRELSRRQGLYATSNTAALAVAAASRIPLHHQLGAPFTLLAIISMLLTLTTLWWWRNVTGNITRRLNARRRAALAALLRALLRDKSY